MGKSPNKFGLGNYSDKPFSLKSGNKIEPGSFFKGEATSSQRTGLYYKSPFNVEEDETDPEVDETVEDKKLEGDTNGDGVVDDKDKKEEKDVKPADKPGTKAWKIAANAFISGFDAIGTTDTKQFTINRGKHEEEVDANSPEQKMKDLMAGAGGKTKKPFSETYNPKHEDGTWKTAEEYNKEYEEYNKA